MQGLTVTLIQSELHWEDVDANLGTFSDKLASITEPTDLILLPETFTTGFSMHKPELGERMDGKALQWLAEQASARNAVVAGSLIVSENDRLHNRFVWMRPDGTYETYDKRHLFSFAGEDEYFTGGNERLILELNGWKIRPLICYDLRFPVWSRQQQDNVYDLLIYVANWPAARVNAWSSLLVARAIENQCYCIGLNRVGSDQNGIEYSGHSAVIDPKGHAMLDFEPGQPAIKTVTLDLQSLNDFRAKFPVGNDADGFEIT